MARVFSMAGWIVAGVVALEMGALDGQWCSADGRSISISGVSVRAPGGQTVTARYGKFALSFDDPERDGVEIWVEPSGADAVRVSTVRATQKEPPPHDEWVRCKRVSHSLSPPGRGA